MGNDRSWRAIEELARLEQRLKIKKGEFISIINTPIIRALDTEEKKEFFSYMKNKGKLGKFLSISAILTLILAVLFRKEITGGVIFESSPITDLLSIFFVLVFVILLLAILCLKIKENKRKNKFRSHMKLAEKLVG